MMSRAPSTMEWTAWQALCATGSTPPGKPKPLNPKPPGRVVPGCGSEAVLSWLMDRPSQKAWWSMHQIIRGTGRTATSCAWAVIYLHNIGAIERERGVQNSRYLRYRAAVE